MDKWTRTEDRMPSEDGRYLVVFQGKSIDTMEFLNHHFRLYGEIRDRLVSHWMKLPEMPEA